MENNLILLLLFSMNLLRVSDATNIKSYKRKISVAIEKYIESKTNSKTGVENLGKCANFCKENICSSFAYTDAEKRCDTYSSMFMEETGIGLTSASYFSKLPKSCSDLGPESPSGVYQIALTSGESFKVYCDMRTVDGPWTVIQNRYDGSESFNKRWDKYREGFGDLNGEFWIGNDIIHTLTQTASVLRIELEASPYKKGYAEYSMFKVTDESDGYKLTLTASTRNVSQDSMVYHSGETFSAKDRGADVNCAKTARGGWWYSGCHQANLNGKYTTNHRSTTSERFITWWYFPGPEQKIPLKKTRMMIRPVRV